MQSRCFIIVIASLILTATAGRAEPVILDARMVPVARIIENLQTSIAADPANVALRINLARAYAMAYATKTTAIAFVDETYRDVLGPSPLRVPYVASPHVLPPADVAAEKVATEHLLAAIAAYEDALTLDPRDSIARLGYGWCLMRSGRRDAIDAFRRVIDDEWSRDSSLTRVGREAITAEAIGYLLPLLDPVRDADEVQALRQKLATLNALPRLITPIIVPLGRENDPARLIDLVAQVRFDADGTGHQHAWSWITPEAAWLVWDPEGTGTVGSALQMFGSVTFWMFWQDGYEALRALDDNGDGTLADDELAGLALWRDVNSNGVSEPGEVKPLAEWGIASLSVRSIPEDESDYVAWSADGVRFADGTTRPTYDILLRRQHRR